MLARLKESGLAIVFITHKLHEAIDLGDRVVVLKQGRVAGSLDREVLVSSSREELQQAIVRLMFGDESSGRRGRGGAARTVSSTRPSASRQASPCSS